MTVKANIRKRRYERIKAILEHQPPREPAGSTANITRPPLPENNRMDDPEYVWNLRRKQFGWDEDPYERARREEERGWKEWMAPPSKTQLGIKIFICALLFFGVWALFHADILGTQEAKTWVARSLMEELDTAAVASWYEQTFKGFPAMLPALHVNLRKVDGMFGRQDKMIAPVSGRIVRSEAADSRGVWVNAPAGSSIRAVDEGRVVYVGRQPETGLTVRIQHAEGWLSVYGMLGEADVSANDWVRKGDVLGTVSADEKSEQADFYLSLSKDRQAVNPMDVIVFD